MNRHLILPCLFSIISVKTPGGKNTVHYIGKVATAPKCGDCGAKINGVRILFNRFLLLFDPSTDSISIRIKRLYSHLILSMPRFSGFILLSSISHPLYLHHKF
jgi:hypothetical protein